MNFNEHSELVGQHALFSPSQSSWLRYDKKKITERILSEYRAPLGTEIHEFSAIQIKLKNKISNIKNLKQSIGTYILSKYELLELSIDFAEKLIDMMGYISNDVYETIKAYINDAIGFRMTPEQVLFYTEDIFGTTDAISFRDNFLRIHDLKTGITPAHMEQLMVYAGIFCLEYNVKPPSIETELRLYQAGDVLIHNPDPEEMVDLIEQITKIGAITRKIRGRAK